MSLLAVTLSVIVGLLLAETRLSIRHEAILRARGAVAPRGDVYAAMAVVYPLGFVAMGAEGIWKSTTGAWGGGPAFYVSGVLLFVASKALKYWAIGALQERWTFRVLVVPGAPLVTHGPYRYLAHPNYVAVVGELAGTAMMTEAWVSGAASLLVFGFLLRRRIAIETQALRAAYEKSK